MEKTKIVGQTKEVGFQIGIRKTLPISFDIAWNFLLSEEGLEIWLGKISSEQFDLNRNYKTIEGIEGKVRVLEPNSHIRLTWKPKNWENISTLQIRVIKAKDGTTISIHQETLLDSNQREEMKEYWNIVIDMLTKKIATTR
jgi:uncharacterized protein YndB with AHSA1/START domain